MDISISTGFRYVRSQSTHRPLFISVLHHKWCAPQELFNAGPRSFCLDSRCAGRTWALEGIFLVLPAPRSGKEEVRLLMGSKFCDRVEVKIDAMFSPVSTCRPILANRSCLFLWLMTRLRGSEAENPNFDKWSLSVSSLEPR
jgi:hypothetical protein